ncbi:MAG: DUF222 domain-containing protein [Acidimicrobiales bacterium]|nr:DUF222 domain-containing protein [Acidimicrobiales bacterium]
MSVLEHTEQGAGAPVGAPGDAGFAALAALHDAAARVLACPWAGRPGPVLGEALEQLVAAERAVAAARTLVLGAFDATGQHRLEGHPSAATWLGARTKSDPRRVKQQVRQGRALRDMPLAAAAFAAGRIGAEHVAVLVRARTRDVVDEYVAAEERLVADAQRLDFDEFARAVRDWRDAVQPDRSERRARDAEQRREAHVSRSFEGMVRIDGWLDPLGGTELLAELHGIEQELFESDWAEARARVGDRATARDLHRTAPQRRADALVEMARRSATCDTPGRPPRWILNITMGWHTLCAEAAATLAELPPGLEGLPQSLARLLGEHPGPGLSPGGVPVPPSGGAGTRPPGLYAGPLPTRHRRAPLPHGWPAADPSTPGSPRRGADTLCELEDFTPIAPSQALALGLAGELRRIVFDADGEILDFGTSRPSPTHALREAVILRDRVCRDPGCTVPGRHGQIDHVVPRSRGGPTSITNLRCECGGGNRLKGTGPPLDDR